MPRRYYSSTAARTTLASGVNNSTTTFSVTAVSGWPTSFPYTLVIDQDTVNEEIVEVTARSGTTLTVTRGVDGTAAVAHSAGAAVNHGVSARDFDEPNAFINGTGVVTETLLASNSVSATKIVDGTITNSKIGASADIAQSKIANLTSDLASKLDLAGGKILQIVRDTDTTNRTTTSTSFVDVTGMSVTITPQKNNSAIILIASARIQLTIASDTIVADFRLTDASNNAISGAETAQIGSQNITGTGTRDIRSHLTLIGYATPATTNATTYKLQFRSNFGAVTVDVLNALTTGQIYAIEVSA